MKIIVIGDLHGNYNHLDRILNTTNAKAYLQVGDFCGSKEVKYKDYPDVSKPVLFISGNHDDPEYLEKFNLYTVDGRILIKRNLWYLPMGNTTIFQGLSIGGLGGIFSSNKFFTDRKELKGKSRLYYTFDVFNKLKSTSKKLEILLTHESPNPFSFCNPRHPYTEGRHEISKLLEVLSPAFHFCGHLHKYIIKDYGRVRSVCVPQNGYIEVEYDKHVSPDDVI